MNTSHNSGVLRKHQRDLRIVRTEADSLLARPELEVLLIVTDLQSCREVVSKVEIGEVMI